MNTSLVLGIDPGKSFFAATLMHSTGAVIWKVQQFDMSREGFDSLVSKLPEGDLTIGIEASGRIDDNLMAWFARWIPTCRNRRVKLIRVNPGQSARFGGPKPRRDQTDVSDSEHIAEYTRVYANRLDAFAYDGKAQSMARLISERQRVVDDLVATKNRIHEQLLVCFPEFIQVFPDPFTKLALAILQDSPTAETLARRQALSLARVKGKRGSQSLGVERARKLIALAKRSFASARETHDREAFRFLLDQLELLEKRLASIEQNLVTYVENAKGQSEAPAAASVPRQIELVDSAPGLGIVAASSLVLGTQGIARFVSGKALSAQWASCPERSETGTSLKQTELTERGDHKRRAMLYLATQIACIYDPAFAFHKWRMVQRGLSPQQAVCAAMNRMARVLWTLVVKNEAYDVNRMVAQIQIHHAELWKTFLSLHKSNATLWKKVDARYKKIA